MRHAPLRPEQQQALKAKVDAHDAQIAALEDRFTALLHSLKQQAQAPKLTGKKPKKESSDV